MRGVRPLEVWVFASALLFLCAVVPGLRGAASLRRVAASWEDSGRPRAGLCYRWGMARFILFICHFPVCSPMGFHPVVHKSCVKTVGAESSESVGAGSRRFWVSSLGGL